MRRRLCICQRSGYAPPAVILLHLGRKAHALLKAGKVVLRLLELRAEPDVALCLGTGSRACRLAAKEEASEFKDPPRHPRVDSFSLSVPLYS
ncbi:hypothetical protein L1887_54475 [Cichorium endivia]|nr:hypothetical protein L1887_54475 [Cichorium endivia]